jgi:hypothetical protein
MGSNRDPGAKADDMVVPSVDADLDEIWAFALTYNAYDRHGGSSGAARLANSAADRWEKDASVPIRLNTARAALFFEQRRYHHFGWDPEGSSDAYIRSLVGRIQKLTGGRVSGPPDPFY